ncbi:MAG TPA: hypothetical protein VGM84_03095 [Steroidobacteraceae bacterium]
MRLLRCVLETHVRSRLALAAAFLTALAMGMAAAIPAIAAADGVVDGLSSRGTTPDPQGSPPRPIRLAARDPYSGAPLPPDRKRSVPSPITDRFYVRGTIYASKLDTVLRVDNSQSIAGTAVSAENDLGLRSKVVQGRMELMFRMRENSRLRVNYYDSDRSATHQLSRTINFGDETFVVKDLANTDLNWRIFGLTYTYSFLHTERFEFGGGIGAYLLQGEAAGEVQSRSERQEVSGVGAFPTVALDGAWRISRRWALTARGQYLRATVNDFSGALGDYHADLQYRWTNAFALGAGFSSLHMSLDVKGGSFPGLLNIKSRGPEGFFRISF